MHLRRRTAALFVTAVSTSVPAWGANSSATPSATPAGVTPRFLGFNNGHFRSTSNTAAWVEYSGVNAMRVWAAASEYTSATEGPTYGGGVTTLEGFEALKSAVRASPETSAYLPTPNWSKTQTGRNNINLDHVLSQLHQRGVDVLLQSTRSTSFDFTGWGGRWEQWKWYYTLAYWAARNYDVQRYQMYNEPDHGDSGISGDRAQYIARLQVASDAIRSAIADVNARYGKSLTADVYGPVAASTTGHLSTWGQDLLKANRTDYAGRPIAVDNVNTYDVHRYNTTGPTFASDQVTIRNAIVAHNASGQDMPIAFTEFNRQNSSSFSSSPNTPDTPGVFTEYAAILTGAMSRDVTGLYAFKFNQTYWTSSSTGAVEPMKTGFYYVEDSPTARSSDAHHTTGSSKGAEVMRLAGKAFEGQRPRYAIGTGNGLNDAAGSYDADARRYYYYSVNRDTAAANVTLNLSNWDVAPGQVISVEEVSASHHGHVSRTFTVPASRTLTFAQSPQSLFLLTIPAGAAQANVDLPAVADASVSLAAPSANNGMAAGAFAARDAAGNNDEATYLKFSLAGSSQPHVSRALLRLTGQNVAGSAASTLHLYGLLNDGWTETGITWSNAPNLSTATDARVSGVGTDAFPLGALTYDGAANEYAVDVTDFVRRHGDAALSFVLLREQRFAGDADTARVRMSTREAASGQPRLSLSLYDRPVYNWRRNGGGSLAAGANFDVNATPDGPGAVLNLGAFITSPQTVSATSAVTVGELHFNNLNAYHLAGPGTVALDNAGAMPRIAVHQGSHRISAPLAFAAPASLVLEPGTMLDIGANSLRLDPVATPAASVRQYISSGQLTFAVADSDTAGVLTLGYAPAVGGELLVKVTRVGDANLDGVLGADDYALIDAGMATGASVWWRGDFNHDGQVTAADYLLIDAAYYRQAGGLDPGTLSLRESRFGPGYVADLLAAVPEPGAAGLAATAGAVAAVRRRRVGVD